MNTLNKICTALTVIFIVSLVVLVAEIVYVLYRRRRFRNRSSDIEFSSETSSFYPTTPSKELLYFFCWKNNLTTRVEPDQAETVTRGIISAAADTPTTTGVADDDDDVDEILKRHAMYGPSRVLFTIKEEEKEDIEMDLSSSGEREDVTVRSFTSIDISTVAVIDIDDTTPFSTPCASPEFYSTPSPSPSRERILNKNDSNLPEK
ncbi:uncharacterized protein LOC126679098 [Mercurialis annua]|uniref:uncharacterized protein LOC126679098 n=1 Tax=Mercurialis annua TaxID=3986 RepID=UPI0021607150|nr:uncharacterized protein LOC126679098 [Mercurialis annua]